MFENLTAGLRDDPKRDAMPTMGFLDHLEELRTRLVYSIAAVAVGFFACWWKVETIYDIMQRPIMKALKDNGMSERLVYLNPTEPFNLYLKIAALAGFFLPRLSSCTRFGCSSLPASTATKSVTWCRSWFRPSRSSPPEDTSDTKSSTRRRWAFLSISAASSSP